MPALTRRRYPERQDCWHVYYGDVHVGTIAIRAGVPVDVDRWGWDCGFYPRSHHGLQVQGTAETFDQARTDFEAAWKEYLPKCSQADFDMCHVGQGLQDAHAIDGRPVAVLLRCAYRYPRRLAACLCRPHGYAVRMKGRPPKDWSQNELERLQAGAKTKASAEEIATSLGRPTASKGLGSRFSSAAMVSLDCPGALSAFSQGSDILDRSRLRDRRCVSACKFGRRLTTAVRDEAKSRKARQRIALARMRAAG